MKEGDKVLKAYLGKRIIMRVASFNPKNQSSLLTHPEGEVHVLQSELIPVTHNFIYRGEEEDGNS